MEVQNGQNRPPQFSKQSKDSKPKTRVGSLGSFSGVSTEYGADKIAASREDSYQSDTAITGQRTDEGLPGEVVAQLIDENEKQLTYHQQQIELIKARIEDLKRIPEILTE